MIFVCFTTYYVHSCQVHSLATVITLKLEVPDGAWVDDPDGTQLAEAINQHLPYNVRVFSILPINKYDCHLSILDHD